MGEPRAAPGDGSSLLPAAGHTDAGHGRTDEGPAPASLAPRLSELAFFNTCPVLVLERGVCVLCVLLTFLSRTPGPQPPARLGVHGPVRLRQADHGA